MILPFGRIYTREHTRAAMFLEAETGSPDGSSIAAVNSHLIHNSIHDSRASDRREVRVVHHDLVHITRHIQEAHLRERWYTRQQHDTDVCCLLSSKWDVCQAIDNLRFPGL